MRRIYLTLIAVTVLAGMAFTALAQNVGGVDLSTFFQWGDKPVLFIAAIAGIVHIIRESGLKKVLDGKFAVGAVSVVAGALAGIVVATISGVHVSPFDQLNPVGAGLTYGAVEGLSSFLGVNIVDLIFARHANAQAKALSSGSGSGNPTAAPPASDAAK